MRGRYLYCAQLQQGAGNEFRQRVRQEAAALREEWTAAGFDEISVFASGPYVCMYAERSDEFGPVAWDWPEAYERCLEKWPPDPGPDRSGGAERAPFRLALPMVDIFRDGCPEDLVEAGIRVAPEERIGAIARLRPEQASSYIFYHYQLQEEAPGGFNASYMIGSFGTLLFSYCEKPARVGSVKRQGRLTTHRSPANWHEVMAPHFEPWEDDPEGRSLWRPMERLL